MLSHSIWTKATAVLVCVAGVGGAAEFAGLGDLPGGATGSEASAISADGRVVVGTASSAARPEIGFNEAFVWTPETDMFGLGFLPQAQNYSRATGVSADGSTVVGVGSSTRAASGHNESFRWTLGEGMIGLGGISGEPVVANSPQATTHDGEVVIGGARLVFHRSVIWGEEAGMSYLPPVPWMDGGQKSWLVDVTPDGAVMAGNSKIGNLGWGEEGFLWSAESGYTHIAPSEGVVTTEVRAVSNDGATVVGGLDYLVDDRVSGGAMWWNAEVGIVDVGGLLGKTTTGAGAYFYDISGDGRTAVGQERLGRDDVRAIIWDQYHGVRDLQQVLLADHNLEESLQGWKLQHAFAASDDGLTIVGRGTNPYGDVEAWRVVLDAPPSPALIPGDANLDGKVDIADFYRLQASFGTGAFWHQGDFDANHRVDFADFQILVRSISRGPSSVPEPSSYSLMCSVAILSVLRRHPKHA